MYAQDDLLRKIREFKRHDAKAMEEVIDRFTPLIQSCSRFHGYEDADARQDMTVALIEILLDLPAWMVIDDDEISRRDVLSYIKASMKNQYVKLSRKHDTRKNREDEYDDEYDYGGQADSVFESVLLDILRSEVSKLAPLQREAIRLKYYQGYSDIEIGKFLGITRQATNQRLNNAYKILKDWLGDRPL